jgi:hypothetical protein
MLLDKMDAMLGIGMIWLRTVSSGELLGTEYSTFHFQKIEKFLSV